MTMKKKPDPLVGEAAPGEETVDDNIASVTVGPKNAEAWRRLEATCREKHWRTLLVKIRFRGEFHGGVPADPKAAEAMIAAQGLKDVLEVRRLETIENASPEEKEKLVEEASRAGFCLFHRRPGKPGLWWPSQHVKSGFKENWQVLELGKSIRGSKTKLAEAMFVFSTDYEDREWIYLGEKADGVATAPCSVDTPQGKRTSLKRNEFMFQREMVFVVRIAKRVAGAVPDSAFMDALVHMGEHGLGANRALMKGTFDIISVEDIEEWPTKQADPKAPEKKGDGKTRGAAAQA